MELTQGPLGSHHKTYLTHDGRVALLKACALAGGAVAATAFLVAPRRRDWQNMATWRELEKHRYAHRGLFDEPPSAEVYPKGTKGDPFKAVDMTMGDKMAQVKSKVTRNADALVATPLWEEDVKTYPNLVPENSLPAFRAAARAGYGIELDVHLTKDNVLVVVHDSDLERLCGRAGIVEQLTHEQLCDYRLLGSDERIPTLQQALAAIGEEQDKDARKVPIIVEIKSTPSNYADVTRMTLLALDRFGANYVIESFDPRVLLYLRRQRPDVFRGQLSKNYMLDPHDNVYDVPAHLAISSLFCNVMGRPDFVAYKYEDRTNPFVFLACRLLRGHLVTWTIRTDADLAESEREGAPAIFEHIRPDVHSRLSK